MVPANSEPETCLDPRRAVSHDRRRRRPLAGARRRRDLLGQPVPSGPGRPRRRRISPVLRPKPRRQGGRLGLTGRRTAPLTLRCFPGTRPPSRERSRLVALVGFRFPAALGQSVMPPLQRPEVSRQRASASAEGSLTVRSYDFRASIEMAQLRERAIIARNLLSRKQAPRAANRPRQSCQPFGGCGSLP